MITCPCGTKHSGARAPFDLAAALTKVLELDARKPDAAALRTHMRCLLAELRGLCASCTFTLAAEMAQAARADVQAAAQAVASHARDLAARDFYSAVEPLTGDAALRTVHPRLRIVREGEGEGEPLPTWAEERR